MAQNFSDRKVIDHFQGTTEYSSRTGFVHQEDPTIIKFLKDTLADGKPVNILEVGGGSGYMLDMISKELPVNLLCNCEIVTEVYKKQVNEKNTLIRSTALQLPFKDESFDVVIIKNLLHHIVGTTRTASKNNAGNAIRELTRVVDNNGYIIVLEQYNKHNLFGSAVFYLTLMFTKVGLHFKSFGWNENVIVSFMTPDCIMGFLTGDSRIRNEILVESLNPFPVSLKYRLTLLMSNIGRLLIISRVHKDK
jgi:Methylase involved in ubiquinone/menaquinone biosynthesis